MEQLSADQLATLASAYSKIGSTIADFLNNNDVEPDSSYRQLSDLSNRCANISTTLAVKAARAIFADAADAFRSLQSVTDDANAAATDLKNEAAQINRGINILTGMVGLAAQLTTGNGAGVLSAVTSLRKAIAS